MANENKFLSGKGGFALTELLIYIGILGITAGVLVGILTSVTKTQVQESSQNDLSGQLNFITQAIQRKVKESSLIDIASGTPTSTLVLRMRDTSTNTVYLSNGQVYLMEGAGSPQALSSGNITVNSLQFKKFSQYPGKDVVQIDLAISANQLVSGQTISRSLRSAVSRVSAATFDADLLPGADNSYVVGNSSSNQRWKSGAFSGNVTVGGNIGIGNTSPSYALDATGGIRVTSTSTFSSYVGFGTSTPSFPVDIFLNDSSVSTAKGILGINRITSGTAGSGIGSSIIFNTQASDGSLIQTGQISSIFSNASSSAPQSAIWLASGNSSGIYINNLGNVGIGNTSPITKLDVSGDLRIGNNDPYHYSYSTLISGFQTPRCSCDTSTSTQECMNEFDSATDQGAVCYDQWSHSYPVSFNASDKYIRSAGPLLALQTSSGNVGIGIASSTSKLTVNGNVSIGASYATTSASSSNGLIVQGNVGIGTSTAPVPLSLNGHIGFYGTAPTISTCGTSASIRGTDSAGIITIGTLAASCTVTFASSFIDVPMCVVDDNSSTSTSLSPQPTTSTLVIKWGATSGAGSASGHNLSYFCSEVTPTAK